MGQSGSGISGYTEIFFYSPDGSLNTIPYPNTITVPKKELCKGCKKALEKKQKNGFCSESCLAMVQARNAINKSKSDIGRMNVQKKDNWGGNSITLIDTQFSPALDKLRKMVKGMEEEQENKIIAYYYSRGDTNT